MHKKIARNKPLWAAMSAGDEQKGPNVRGFRALFAPRGQIRRDVRMGTKIPPESAGDGRRGGTLQHFTLLKCIYSKNYLTIYRNSAILNLYEGRWHCNEIAGSNMQMWERRYFRIAKQATHKTNMRKMRTLH